MNSIVEMIEILANNLSIVSVIPFSGLIFSIISAVCGLKKGVKKEQKDTAEKIEEISSVLSKSAQDIITIEQELQKRIEKVNELKNQAAQAENLLSMTQEQVDAIRKSINQEINKDSKKNFWTSVAVTFIFFLLGAIVSFIISYSFAHTSTPIPTPPTN